MTVSPAPEPARSGSGAGVAGPGGGGRRGRLALAVAEAVDTVPGARRSPGGGIEVSTQYPGGRVIGIRLDAGAVTVHVVAERLPLPELVDAVHAAVLGALEADSEFRTVAVVVDDLDVERLPGASRDQHRRRSRSRDGSRGSR